ncbi:hypothetical protein GCM10010160_40560 [Acrocarpospora corrugata]|uniref:hypothetical protein n=1 Tax=Acrocarpospora corrugata TaxID=35763 RepID=UPI0031D1C2B4
MITTEQPDLSLVPDQYGLSELVASCLAKIPADRPTLDQILTQLNQSGAEHQGALLTHARADISPRIPQLGDVPATPVPPPDESTPSTALPREKPSGSARTTRRPTLRRTFLFVGLGAVAIAVSVAIIAQSPKRLPPPSHKETTAAHPLEPLPSHKSNWSSGARNLRHDSIQLPIWTAQTEERN